MEKYGYYYFNLLQFNFCLSCKIFSGVPVISTTFFFISNINIGIGFSYICQSREAIGQPSYQPKCRWIKKYINISGQCMNILCKWEGPMCKKNQCAIVQKRPKFIKKEKVYSFCACLTFISLKKIVGAIFEKTCGWKFMSL